MKTYIGIKVNSELEYLTVAELVAIKLGIKNNLYIPVFKSGYCWILYGVEEKKLFHSDEAGFYSYSEETICVDSKAKTVDEFIKFVNDCKNPKIKIELNKEYTAEITADKVVVGCQTFEADTILEVTEAIKKLRNK